MAPPTTARVRLLGDVRELTFESFGNASMKRASWLPQQSPVSRILYEGVLEQVGYVRRHAPCRNSRPKSIGLINYYINSQIPFPANSNQYRFNNEIPKQSKVVEPFRHSKAANGPTLMGQGYFDLRALPRPKIKRPSTPKSGERGCH